MKKLEDFFKKYGFTIFVIVAVLLLGAAFLPLYICVLKCFWSLI
jgi:hypothetical protein